MIINVTLMIMIFTLVACIR